MLGKTLCVLIGCYIEPVNHVQLDVIKIYIFSFLLFYFGLHFILRYTCNSVTIDLTTK